MRRVLVVLAAALLISGCASGDAHYPAATAEKLQNGVLAVTQAASDGDLEAALTRLDELTASTRDALARGSVTEARHESILTAIDLVRGDLEALIAQKAEGGENEEPATEPATDSGEAPENSGSGDDSGEEPAEADDSGNGDESAGEENPDEENPGDENPGSGESGNGGSGNGDGNGNGEEPTEPTDEQTAPPTEQPKDPAATGKPAAPVQPTPTPATPAPSRGGGN